MSALKKSQFSAGTFSDQERQTNGPDILVEQLQQENQQLQRQLRAFITKARQNEEKLAKFQALELKLIQCNSLFDLLSIMLNDYRTASSLETVSLLLLDSEYEIRRLLEEDGVVLGDHPSLKFCEEPEKAQDLFGGGLAPYLGAPHRRHDFLFGEQAGPIRSVALFPMIRHGQLVGCLALGSEREERFIAGVASDFLQRLVTILTVCLDNVTNNERLKRVGLTDVLTGVNNRRFFDQRLFEEVLRAERSHKPMACLFFDVDHFKQVNDTYGHHVGDRVLQEIAGLIRASLRGSDVLARYGGEEFAALLGGTTAAKAGEIAERIRESIAGQNFTLSDGRRVKVTLSVGISILTPEHLPKPLDGRAVGQQLVQRADECLYRAKHEGRNRVIMDDRQLEASRLLA